MTSRAASSKSDVFVTFEGIGGAGKTTQARLLEDWLRSSGLDVVGTREPGGTPLGEEIRKILLERSVAISPRSEALLFAAARTQLVDEVIRPALQRGAYVISDRFIDSSIVYQGVLQAVGVEDVLSLNLSATAGVLPDVTFLLLIDVDEAGRRRLKSDSVEPLDRDRRLQIDSAYRELARNAPERIIEVDAAPRPDIVFQHIREIVKQRLGWL